MAISFYNTEVCDRNEEKEKQEASKQSVHTKRHALKQYNHICDSVNILT